MFVLRREFEALPAKERERILLKKKMQKQSQARRQVNENEKEPGVENKSQEYATVKG